MIFACEDTTTVGLDKVLYLIFLNSEVECVVKEMMRSIIKSNENEKKR